MIFFQFLIFLMIGETLRERLEKLCYSGQALVFLGSVSNCGLRGIPFRGCRFDVAPREYEFRCGDSVSVIACIDRIAAERPELIIASSDYVAAMTVSRFGRRGIRVPEDLSVVSIDGTRWAELYNPPLTAIKQDSKLLAKAGGEELLQAIDGNSEPHAITIPTTLKSGGSVKIDQRCF